jgi:hypothetical protein
MRAPFFGQADVTAFSKAYDTLTSATRTSLAAEDVIRKFLYNCPESTHKTVKMMNGYVRKDWVQLKEELKDAFRHADS